MATAEEQLRFIKRRIKKLPRTLAQTTLLESMALKGESLIKRRTRNGFGITKWLGRLVNLRIKKSTVKTKESLRKQGKLSNKTAPGVANLTRTGHMLDFIHITSKNKQVFEMRPDASDLQKVNDLRSRGIQFFGFTKDEFNTVKNLGLDIIIAQIKKMFN